MRLESINFKESTNIIYYSLLVFNEKKDTISNKRIWVNKGMSVSKMQTKKEKNQSIEKNNIINSFHHKFEDQNIPIFLKMYLTVYIQSRPI